MPPRRCTKVVLDRMSYDDNGRVLAANEFDTEEAERRPNSDTILADDDGAPVEGRYMVPRR